MSRMRPSNNISIRFLIFLLLMTTGLSHVLAKGNNVEIPLNARAKSYGKGWECERGYRAKDKVCVAIKVPDNAYSTNSSFGNGWKCKWGFRRNNDICVAIRIPANAYLDSYGHAWKCKRGFQSVDNTCVSVKVPKNGYLVESSYGQGWTCERGYKAKNDICVAFKIPVNAHIDYSGHNWACNPPYTKQQNKCELSISNF